MDNNKNPSIPDEDGWFDALLTPPGNESEIGPDEGAISDLRLPEISDMELEKILQEALAEDWPAEDPVEEEAPILDQEYRDAGSDAFDGYENNIWDDSYSDDHSQDEYSEPEYSEDDSEEASDSDPENASSVRKVRPRRKNGYGLFGLPHLLSTVIWFAIVVAIGASFGRLLWVCASDILAFGREDQAVTLTITESDTVDTITEKLHNAGLIQYPQLFKLYAGLSNAEKKISAGTFTLNTLYDYNALVRGMTATSSYRETVEVMIPEGYNCAQIFALLEEKGVCSAADLEEFAANGEFNERWFLEGLERGDKYCLEGYLFPDTYEFYSDDTPARVLGKMLDGFGNRLDEAKFQEMLVPLNQKLAQMMASHGYNQDYINKNLMDLRRIIILASIVEKESASSAESYTIASVFYNRLTHQSAYPKLESDATVYYAIGGNKDGDLTASDLKFDSPYNTYLYPGLTPGPISNPSLASIYSVLDPDDTTYHYFIYDKNSEKTRFSSTLEEHNEWKNILGG